MRLTLSILMIVAVVAGFAAFIVPHYHQISALRVQEADYQTILQNARTLQEERNTLVTKYNSFDPQVLAKLNQMLPNNPENMKLILELYALASQYGLSLQNVKIEDPAADASQTAVARPGAVAPNNEIGTLKINFSVAGPYGGFTDFLRAVEKSLRIIDIQKISFSAADDKAQGFQYTVGIKTYWLK